ncbi:MAG: hypothetical protein ACRDNK_04280 [Solirubrobacteraceae bacterium]
MTTVPLSEYAFTKLDGSGNGTVRLGPTAHGVVWNPTVASIKATGAIPAGLATCTVYAGSSATDDNFVDATYDVTSAATDAIAGNVLRLGGYLYAVWSGGTPGATATLSVAGTKEIP